MVERVLNFCHSDVLTILICVAVIVIVSFLALVHLLPDTIELLKFWPCLLCFAVSLVVVTVAVTRQGSPMLTTISANTCSHMLCGGYLLLVTCSVIVAAHIHRNVIHIPGLDFVEGSWRVGVAAAIAVVYAVAVVLVLLGIAAVVADLKLICGCWVAVIVLVIAVSMLLRLVLIWLLLFVF